MGIFSTNKDDTTPAQRNFVPRTSQQRSDLADLAGQGRTKDLRSATTRTKDVSVHVGRQQATKDRDAVRGTRETRQIKQFDSISFDQAQKDFDARGGNRSKVEAQPKAAGGGSGAAIEAFEPGAITASGIIAQEFGVDSNTPVNSKQRGR